MFERKSDIWFLHIFELKRTVSSGKWEEIKLQFAGAMVNALAMAGYLNININPDNVDFYTCYRNDRMNNGTALTKERMKMTTESREQKAETTIEDEWNSGFAELLIINERAYPHHKVQLDLETGEDSICL